MMRAASRVALTLLALLAVSGGLKAQVPVERLSEPEATFPEAFSLIQTVRELPDGRVMIADPLGQALVIADIETGTADTLGGVGPGPGEYRQPDAVFGLPGDSTLLVDLGNARLTVVAPDGSFTRTIPIVQGEPGTGALLIMLPRGTDSEGNIYFQPMGGRATAQLPDSAPVVRYDPGAGTMDTLAMVKLQSMSRATSGGPGNQNVMIRPRPLTPQDAWSVAWDGRVAIARSGDYHVEWVQPDGRVVRGAPVPYEPVKVRRADKEEWVESLANGIRIGISIENGDRRMSMGRGGGADGPDIDGFDWPDTKPPFASNGVLVTPEGDTWVERHVPAGEEKLYDVFGADASLKGQVRLPAGRDVVGFGRGRVYVVRTDDLGLQWLEAYRRRAS